jgi:hypothetical protein
MADLFSATVGMAMGWAIIGFSFLYTLATSMLVYVMAIIMPVKWTGPAVFVLSMTVVSVGHIWRMQSALDLQFTLWNWEFTLLQMVLTVKQIIFAYTYTDGVLINRSKVSILL